MYYHQLIIIVIKALYLSLHRFITNGWNNGILYIAMSLGVSSSMSAVLLFTNPLWLAVLAHFILKERLTMIKMVALVIGVIGVTICLGLDVHC